MSALRRRGHERLRHALAMLYLRMGGLWLTSLWVCRLRALTLWLRVARRWLLQVRLARRLRGNRRLPLSGWYGNARWLAG